MAFQKRQVLNVGLNLFGLTDSVNTTPGELEDCQDVLFRDDGPIYKHWGFRRDNAVQLAGRPLAVKGFTYRGKNNDSAANPNRPGNWGVADDGAIFTRRKPFWASAIILTTTTFYFRHPVTGVYTIVALPGGVSVLLDPKPTIVIQKENAYIVGWADRNLRWDPTDQVLYRWGWENVPAAPGGAVAAGGTLEPNKTYKYKAAWFDVYTGEESSTGTATSFTTTTANRTVNLTFANYAGTRHFTGAGTNRDVAIVVYRTGANDDTFRFLALLNPSTVALTDDGLATAPSIRPYTLPQTDEPRFNTLWQFRGLFFANAWRVSTNRLFHSDFRNAAYNIERWPVLNFRDLPVPEGEIPTTLASVGQSLLQMTQKGAFHLMISPNARDGVTIFPTRLPWSVGCVAPRAWTTENDWLHFLSLRGPYRWREGLAEPEPIGKKVTPLFIDPTSELCKLDGGNVLESELIYDQTANGVRYLWAADNSATPNRQLFYWVDAAKATNSITNGFALMSPRAQCFDYTFAFGGTANADGTPLSAFQRKEFLVFGDDRGYINEYDPASQRGGLNLTAEVKGKVLGGTATTLTIDPLFSTFLYTTGDGLRGMTVEVKHVNGTRERREIASNTTNTITVTVAFASSPGIGDLWWVAGMPSFFRTCAEHFGEPMLRKRAVHLASQFIATHALTGGAKLDVAAIGGRAVKTDPPTDATERTVEATLSNVYNRFVVNFSAKFWKVQFANTRPDETYVVTMYEWDVALLGRRQGRKGT